MLARRELFTGQMRDRLLRKGFTPQHSEEAIHRLCQDGALDDRRAAGAYARDAVRIKSRGRNRTLRELGELGVGTNDAQHAVDDAYAAVDEADLLDRALGRRLPGPIENRAQYRRLYSALLRQGFESGAVVAALKAKMALTTQTDDEAWPTNGWRRASVKK